MSGDKSGLKNELTIVVVGRSGSGKGTQAKFILEKLGKNVHNIETGKILRNFIRKSNSTAEIVRKILKEGFFMPSWLVSFLWLKEFVEKESVNRHLVFDGSPRTFEEAKLLDEVVGWYERSLPLCIYVDIGMEEAIKRLLKRGRSDDILPAIKNRLKSFSKQTLPVVNYYKKQRRLVRIDGTGSPEKVWDGINHELKRRLGSLWPSP